MTKKAAAQAGLFGEEPAKSSSAPTKKKATQVESPKPKNAVARVERRAPAPREVRKAVREVPHILAVIAEAARDPAVDAVKMRMLLEMRKEIVAEEARLSFNRAMVAVRPKLPTINQNGLIEIPEKEKAGGRTTRKQATRYPKLVDVNESVKPILNAHGFDIWHQPGIANDGKVSIVCHLEHVDGHAKTCEIVLPHDSGGSKNAVQAVSSSISYGKRIGTIALLNLDSRAPIDVDDDGRAAGKVVVSEKGGAREPQTVELGGLISAPERDELKKAIDDCGVPIETFCGKYEIESIEQLPVRLLAEALDACAAFKQNQARARRGATGGTHAQ